MPGDKKTGPGDQNWPAYKERLVTQHASDRKLPGAAKSVGIFLVTHLNKEVGSAWPSVARIVHFLGYNRRTVQRALDLLVARGHWQIVEQGGGAGRTTVYAPIPWEPSDTKRAVKVPLLHSEQRAVGLSQKGGQDVQKRAVATPPEPYKEPEKEPTARGCARLASPPEGGGLRYAASATAQQRRQAEAEAARQAEYQKQLAEDPVARLVKQYAAFIGKSRSLAVAEWMLWLPGAVEAAGEAEVKEWHRHAEERAPDRPLPYLRDRLADWHQARQASLAEADSPSAGEPKPGKQGDPGGDDDLRDIPDFLRRIPVPKGI